MSPLFVLLTDLGLSDPYVGQMRGMLHRLAPDVPVLDLSHGVPRHDVRTGAFFLSAGLPYFAPGAIFLVVVDPGVGTERALLCLHARERVCIAPNNGFLALAARNYSWDGLVSVDPNAVRQGLDLPPLSATFHGRDIIAPLAARLAAGAGAESFGVPLDMATDLRSPSWSAAQRTKDGIKTAVLHIDSFGNVVLNAAVEEWAQALLSAEPHLPQYNDMPVPACASYAAIPAGGVGIIPGSQGYLELACNRASAAKVLGLKPGHVLHIRI